jgi:hypothetical protein
VLEAYLATLLSEFQDHVDPTISSDSDSSGSSDDSKSDDDQLTPVMHV